MEITNGSILGVRLPHQLGGSCDGNNLMEGKLWVYKILGSKCTSRLGHIVLINDHTMHLAFGG
jgi:hypothetical protein